MNLYGLIPLGNDILYRGKHVPPYSSSQSQVLPRVRRYVRLDILDKKLQTTGCNFTGWTPWMHPVQVIMRELPPIDIGTNRSKVRGPSYLGTQQVGLKFRSQVTRIPVGLPLGHYLEF
uniref:Uncharacterized protein n=1 Tax=Quercus lobata TaxID=97700 RepID=A0A7N2KMV5_QUELO